MAQANLNLRVLWRAVEAVREHGTVSAAARVLDVPRTTLQHQYNAAQQEIARGRLSEDGIVPGFDLKSVTTDEDADGNVVRRHIKQVPSKGAAEDPEGLSIKGLSQYVDGQGNLIGEWRKYDKDKIDPAEVAKQIAEAFDGMKIKKPRIDTPSKSTKDLLTLYPVADWHLGLMAWGREAEEDWDLSIAVKSLEKTMSELVMRSPVSDTAVLLSVGDMVHADTKDNKTNKSGNVLDVDGRYQKIVHETCYLMLRVAMMILQKHKKLIIRILPGNHDEHTCVAVAYFLAAAFKDEKRVNVDLDPSLFWVFSFGEQLLAATHGHTMKPAKLYQWLTGQHRDKWGAATKVHGFLGHFHHKEKLADEMGGMLLEILPAPIPPDAWHYGAGYISGRSMSTYTYHAKDGLISQIQQTMRK